MLVSIIIPSYRQPQFLERAITSCLEQDHQELEVIVVEDRSGDASLGIAASIAVVDDRVKIVSCDQNGGLGKARNLGIAHASGELLCFLDSDDYLLERSISARVDAFPAARAEHGAGVVGVYGDWQHVAETIDHPVVRQPRAAMPLVNTTNYTGENVFICSAPLVRRDAVVAAGGFPEGLRMLEDFALWAKMIASGGVFVPVHHVVSTYRQRPNSMLRGDGLVVMADHVRVINDWVESEGTALADGGALSAWLENRDPRPFGRMTWSIPSVLGSFGGGPQAASVHATPDRQDREALGELDDFMSEPVTSGLETSPVFWGPERPADIDLVLPVSTLGQCLQAIALAELAASNDVSLVVTSEGPETWFDTWPLALAGLSSMSNDDRSLAGLPRLDLASVADDAVSSSLVRHGAEVLWPESTTSSAAVVFVPQELSGYPALDAWLSTALHALASRGEDPSIMSDPRIRPELGGYRSELTSIEQLRRCSVIVAPVCRDLAMLSSLAPTVVFDPSAPKGDHPRTRVQLESALEDLDGVTADTTPFDSAVATSLLRSAIER